MTDFNWTLHPESEAFVENLLAQALGRSPQLQALQHLLAETTSTRLMNWLDHLGGPVTPEDLAAAGFEDGFNSIPGVWRHPGAQLPAIVPGDTYVVALRVDDAAAFAHALLSNNGVEGSPMSGYRAANVATTSDVAILGVERRSWACGVAPQTFTDAQTLAAVAAHRAWAERPRPNASGPGSGIDGVRYANEVAQRMVTLVGTDLAASYVLEFERAYWQRRNAAGVLQHARQDRIGLGWGNNDHHTFRSSRTAFRALIEMFNTLGFKSRERFYAGDQAGWGAQVLEHPGCGGVLFTDVDLEPGEVDLDFTGADLPISSRLGTVGMWCALHGESILGAGMHHLEGQFQFAQLRDDLSDLSVASMKPFSTFPHLQQAFTEAERWPVSSATVATLLAGGYINEQKAAEFLERGAAGSHLENLQRRAGYKGFNQQSVSQTMAATDPRTYLQSHGSSV